MSVKPGARLRSVSCDTEVVVVQAASTDVTLECGGRPMVDIGSDAAPAGAPVEGFDGGSSVGKRYTDAGATIEVLCTKGGTGSLAVDGQALGVKDAKPLPSSD
jgi:hypothetical protein